MAPAAWAKRTTWPLVNECPLRPDTSRRIPRLAAKEVASDAGVMALLERHPALTAARKMTGRRFLSAAAPRLPLAGCDVLECACRFVHHQDRRSGSDRRSPFGPGGYSGSGNYKAEQRKGRERRKKPDNFLE